jgi:hypothetical protein
VPVGLIGAIIGVSIAARFSWRELTAGRRAGLAATDAGEHHEPA